MHLCRPLKGQKALSSTLKVCPICQTSHAPSVLVCRMCGASLAKVESVARVTKRASANQDATAYDFRHGENDLIEQPLSRRGQTCFTIAITALVAFFMGAVFVAMAPSVLNRENIQQPAATNTPMPSPAFATVTQGPPTATASNTPLPTPTASETHTPAPCMQVISAGDNLYSALTRCGYRASDVILPTVMMLNGLSDAASLQIGQEIIIPWPTATTDPNMQPTEAAMSSTQSSESAEQTDLLALDESIDAFAPTTVPTLPAGLMWHRIQANENLASVTNLYGVNMKILSELNPEMDFGQCDFGNAFGGPNCNVMVSIGQEIRVPAPTPTPTLSPTHDPNSTATPTATPTYNKPFPVSPSDRQFFRRDELVTLRWTPTGTLALDELYRVDVEDMTSGVLHTEYTRDIFLLIPTDWQGTQKPRHDFTWTVGIVTEADRSRLQFATTPRTFVWQGLVDEESETETK